MCHNHSTPPPSDLTPSSTTPPRRRNRSKTRKPKYLSLRLQLNPSHHKPARVSDSALMTHGHQQQLNLFPLHPENLVDDKDMMQDDHNVAFLFASHAPASLNGLLRHDSTTTTTTTEEEEEECVRRDEENGRSLLRKAMKRGSKEEEGDGREERWVCYSEVTSYSSGNTTESTATTTTTTTTTFGLLSLKLDYEGVLNAWSDQRSLYVPGETPLAVPHHVLPHPFPNEQDSVSGKEKEWEEEEEGGGERRGKREREREKKMGQREASVLRYKQKRESRLFSKRIRYEVRKLNAEKRPRMKGRFVKRD